MLNILLIGDVVYSDTISNVKIDLDFTDVDLIIFNLEAPLVDKENPKAKAGPHLINSLDIVKLFPASKTIANLANNHIMDHGVAGLQNTIKLCKSIGIHTCGAGNNLNEAFTPKISIIDGQTVGVLSIAETQFGIATPWKGGIAPIIPGETAAKIKNLADKLDIFILSIHGGAEMCPWPSPIWQKMLRSFIDLGVNVIYGHHSHIPQGFEAYNDGLIFYGLGNFLVEPEKWSKKTNTLWSILGHIEFIGGKINNYQLRTSVVDATDMNVSVRESTTFEFRYHQEYISTVNQHLSNEKLLNGLWQESSIRMYYLWYEEWLGFGQRLSFFKLKSFLRRIYFILLDKTIKHHNNKEKLLLWYHLFVCETHRDSISTALGVLSNELEDYRNLETKKLADEMLPWSTNYLNNL